MRSREDRQRLAVAVEIGELWVGAREMALEVENAVAALEEERELAGDEPFLAICSISTSVRVSVKAGGR